MSLLHSQNHETAITHFDENHLLCASACSDHLKCTDSAPTQFFKIDIILNT